MPSYSPMFTNGNGAVTTEVGVSGTEPRTMTLATNAGSDVFAIYAPTTVTNVDNNFSYNGVNYGKTVTMETSNANGSKTYIVISGFNSISVTAGQAFSNSGTALGTSSSTMLMRSATVPAASVSTITSTNALFAYASNQPAAFWNDPRVYFPSSGVSDGVLPAVGATLAPAPATAEPTTTVAPPPPSTPEPTTIAPPPPPSTPEPTTTIAPPPPSTKAPLTTEAPPKPSDNIIPVGPGSTVFGTPGVNVFHIPNENTTAEINGFDPDQDILSFEGLSSTTQAPTTARTADRQMLSQAFTMSPAERTAASRREQFKIQSATPFHVTYQVTNNNTVVSSLEYPGINITLVGVTQALNSSRIIPASGFSGAEVSRITPAPSTTTTSPAQSRTRDEYGKLIARLPGGEEHSEGWATGLGAAGAFLVAGFVALARIYNKATSKDGHTTHDASTDALPATPPGLKTPSTRAASVASASSSTHNTPIKLAEASPPGLVVDDMEELQLTPNESSRVRPVDRTNPPSRTQSSERGFGINMPSPQSRSSSQPGTAPATYVSGKPTQLAGTAQSAGGGRGGSSNNLTGNRFLAGNRTPASGDRSTLYAQ